MNVSFSLCIIRFIRQRFNFTLETNKQRNMSMDLHPRFSDYFFTWTDLQVNGVWNAITAKNVLYKGPLIYLHDRIRLPTNLIKALKASKPI